MRGERFEPGAAAKVSNTLTPPLSQREREYKRATNAASNRHALGVKKSMPRSAGLFRESYVVARFKPRPTAGPADETPLSLGENRWRSKILLPRRRGEGRTGEGRRVTRQQMAWRTLLFPCLRCGLVWAAARQN